MTVVVYLGMADRDGTTRTQCGAKRYSLERIHFFHGHGHRAATGISSSTGSAQGCHGRVHGGHGVVAPGWAPYVAGGRKRDPKVALGPYRATIFFFVSRPPVSSMTNA